MVLKELTGYDLGERDVAYGTRDAILYALAVGANAEQLDLVYERDLRVLPTFACALGLWAVEQAGTLGAYDRKRSLHAAQTLVMHKTMPREGRIATYGRIATVWDKSKASIVEIEVRSAVFTAIYTIFLPGIGNWGGEPGPRAADETPVSVGEPWQLSYRTSANLAALYRLTGDLHPIHIDPEIARANGFERPILHGLCTLGIAARAVANAAGVHPADLRSLTARLSGAVLPGDSVDISIQRLSEGYVFDAAVGDRAVLKSGRTTFSSAT